ncbi:MAG: hypothetical protein WB588_03125 [Dehalococcoidia bacterium]
MEPRIVYDQNVTKDSEVFKTVRNFIDSVKTLELSQGNAITIHQDGVDKSYYIRCCLQGNKASKLVDLDARLIPDSPDSFRANRQLLLTHKTYLRMSQDAENGREFNDIIVEYNTSYSPEKPLKVWGGQHRSKAVLNATNKDVSRYHGFRVYLCLSKTQRSNLALISNTNINVSPDLFDRQLEETLIGPFLRQWCVRVGLLADKEDFPDTGSRAETVTTQAARTFIVNYFMGRQMGKKLSDDQLDQNYYAPYLCESGDLDENYDKLVKDTGKKLWNDSGLEKAGKAFAMLNKAQSAAVHKSKNNRKGFRTKALTLSVLPAWAYVAGLLESHASRLQNHLAIPKTAKGAVDPLNAAEMSRFKHDQDPVTYRGLGNRSSMKERERMAQVFLARSLDSAATFDKKLLDKAVSQVVGLKVMKKGYTT